MGMSVAMRAARRGMDVTVATRRPRRLFDGREAIGLAEAAAAAPSVDAVVVALPVSWDAIAASAPDRLPPVVDLSSPGAIPAAVRAGLAGGFVDIDVLFAGAPDGDADPDPATTRRYAARAEEEVERAEREFAIWLAARPGAASARRLIDRATLRRDARVERTLRRLPDLDERGRALVRQLAEQVAADLLHEPLARLRADTDGSALAAAGDLFDL